jgi:rhomboid protease GluP
VTGSSRPDLGSGIGDLLERYPVTFGVLGANLVLFLFAALKSGSPWFDVELLVRLGGNRVELVSSQPWRLLAAVFLHGDILHFALNSVALFFVGRMVEVHYGWARTFTLYVLCGLASSLGSVGWNFVVLQSKTTFFTASAVSVGASGAILGLIFVGYVYARAEAHRLGSIAGTLQRWIIFALVLTFLVPRIDVAGHVCGSLAGGALGYFVRPRPGKDPHPAWKPAAIFAAFLCFFCFVGVVWAMRSGRALG